MTEGWYISAIGIHIRLPSTHPLEAVYVCISLVVYQISSTMHWMCSSAV